MLHQEISKETEMMYSSSPRKIQKENLTKDDKQIFEKPAIPKPK